MARIHSPKVVTDGLVLYLDSMNPKSYPGSANTLYDLVSTNNVAITGGIVYTNNAIDMAGSTHYGSFTIPNFTTSVCTVEMIAKYENITNTMPFGWYAYDVYTHVSGVGYNTAAGDVYGIPAAKVTELGLLNNIKHYAFVMRSDVSYVNNKIYVNGVEQALSQVLGSQNASNRSFNSGTGRIAGWIINTSYRMPMELYTFKVYNRELSASEVFQNYTALRGRFNI